MKNIYLILLLFFGKNLFAQEIILRTNVDNLRLRTEPNLQSKVIKELQKGEVLTYLDEKSKNKETLDWRGKKVSDYWYKVSDGDSENAWIFGKGLGFHGIKFGNYKEPITPKPIDNEWISIENSSKINFDEAKTEEVKVTLNNNYDLNSKQPYICKLDNGRKIEINENNSEGYHIDQIRSTISLNGKKYYQMEYISCMGGIYWLRKSDGEKIYWLPIQQNSGKTITSFAPDKKTIFFQSGCEFSDNNDCEGLPQSIVFNIGEFVNDERKTLFYFEEFRVQDFRFITNRSGIAKMRDDTYLKITIKTP